LERPEPSVGDPEPTGSEDEELSGDNRKKRTVAMHVGYLGTNFRGSQLIREMPPEESVEGTLELALLKVAPTPAAAISHMFTLIIFNAEDMLMHTLTALCLRLHGHCDRASATLHVHLTAPARDAIITHVLLLTSC
jgi:hypothetical protein